MKRLAALLALALLLASVSAAADVRRGDRGEEVRYLQWLLFENGWLFEEPDGIFGAHTEAAVKDYQRAKGLEATGEADYALMEKIDRDRVALDREHFGPDYYQPYDGDFVPPFPTVPETEQTEGVYVPPAHCEIMALRSFASLHSCERHLALERLEATLTQSGEAEGYARAREMWLEEVGALFNACVAEAPAAQKLDWLSAWTAWNAAFAQQLDATRAAWPDDPAQAEREAAMMLRRFAGALCELRSGEIPCAPGPNYLEPEAKDYAEDFSQFWSEEPGAEAIAPCGEHAALLGREYELAWSDALGGQALEDLSADWDQSLLALYDEWLSLRDEAAGEAIRNARADFFKAQTALAIALEPYGVADIARLRLTQLECARLCEFLRYIQMAE